MLNTTLKRQNYLVFAAFTALTFIFWKTSAHFFWKDEWYHLKAMQNISAAYLFEPINGQIVPLFKLFYFLELSVFGTNCLLFLYTNLLLYALTIYFVYKLLVLLNTEPKFAFIACCLILAHPVNYNHLLWTFQVAQTLQFLFQVLTIYLLIRLFATNENKLLYLSLGTLFIQNYFFGNGVLFPLVFLGFTLFYPKRTNKLLLAGGILLFVCLAGIQIQFGKFDSATIGILANAPEITKAMLYFNSLNISRYLFMNEKVIGAYSLIIAPAIFGFFLILGFFRSGENKKQLTLFLFWLCISGTAVSIARWKELFTETKIPDYYSALSLIPFSILLILCLNNILRTISFKPALKMAVGTAVISVFIIYFLADSRMTNTYTIRHIRNEENMMRSIKNNSPYYAFDDPHFCDLNNPRADGFYEYMIPDPKDVFIYWRSRTRVNLGSNLKNE